jgi:hypothetical protein
MKKLDIALYEFQHVNTTRILVIRADNDHAKSEDALAGCQVKAGGLWLGCGDPVFQRFRVEIRAVHRVPQTLGIDGRAVLYD